MHALRHQLGRALAVIADLEAADFDILDQQIIGLDARDAAGGKPDHHQAAAPGERAQRRLERVAADRVEHDVDAVAVVVREHLFAQRVAQVVLRQVDDGVGAGT